ncbi:MAG TPA: hypothetical protein PK622_13640 [Saprospiraceae bacterium]|nr:hypothetical protein [Saprospiraceae bacterium]
MENKDFRDRLVNRPAPMNPASWEHMQILLDAQATNHKKKRKRYFLSYFAITLIILFGIILLTQQYYDNTNIQNNFKDFKIHSSDQRHHPLKSSPVNKENPLRGTDVVEQSIYSALNLKKRVDEQSAEFIHNNEVARNQELKENKKLQNKEASNEYVIIGKKFAKGLKHFTMNRNESEPKSNIASNETTFPHTFPTASQLTTVTNNTDLMPKQTDNLLSLNETNPVMSGDLKHTLMHSMNNMNNNWTTTKLDQLTIEGPIHSIHYLNTNINKLPALITPSKSKGLYLCIHGGLVLFNQNPGYNLGIGILKDNHPLFGIGAEIRYTHASEPNVLAGLPKTIENQSDINAYFQLKLIRNRSFKAAFEIGSGYTFYSGQRVRRGTEIIIDKRSSNGINFNGGLDLTYNLNKTNLIGLKIGTILYDDQINYINLKYAISIH